MSMDQGLVADLPVKGGGSFEGLLRAVRRSRALSRTGLAERLFAHVFDGLVYAQIWEDPEIDMEALEIGPGSRVVTIASGGCNALSYLVADPAHVEAVDLNANHVALTRLKLAAIRFLPDHAQLRRFFCGAGGVQNIRAYDRFILPHLGAGEKAYWGRRGLGGRRRIAMFSGNPYRCGLLGLFIGSVHRIARLYGVDPRDMLLASSLADQKAFFDDALAPVFDKRLVRWLVGRRSSLFGLGIPPQQYESLASAGAGDMVAVLRERLRKLACDFPLADNYFARQAFGRAYGDAADGSVPPYLQRQNFERVRQRAGRVAVVHASYTDFLAVKPTASVDRFVLLDAQDWMNDAQLNALWREITRTAAPGARVIFRTAAAPSVLPGRLDPAVLSRWDYREGESVALHVRDRSSIYGGFHLYMLRGSTR